MLTSRLRRGVESSTSHQDLARLYRMKKHTHVRQPSLHASGPHQTSYRRVRGGSNNAAQSDCWVNPGLLSHAAVRVGALRPTALQQAQVDGFTFSSVIGLFKLSHRCLCNSEGQ